MALTTRQGKGSRLTIQEMDNNLLYLEQLAQGGGALPVVTDYPETTPSLAGTRFWYKGNEWHYMTQDEIDSAGWTGLVSVGFPAPVRKIEDRTLAFDGNVSFDYLATYTFTGFRNNVTYTFDCLGLGNPVRAINIPRVGGDPGVEPTVTFRNINLLTNLSDLGTTLCFRAEWANLTEEVINDLFTQLPPTTKTATINVSNNPGSATCDPTIATAKGYTVIT